MVRNSSEKIKELVLTDSIACTIAPDNSYVLYDLLNKWPDIAYEVSFDGQFIITCAKSMTSKLLTELNKIDTLALENEK